MPKRNLVVTLHMTCRKYLSLLSCITNSFYWISNPPTPLWNITWGMVFPPPWSNRQFAYSFHFILTPLSLPHFTFSTLSVNPLLSACYRLRMGVFHATMDSSQCSKVMQNGLSFIRIDVGNAKEKWRERYRGKKEKSW